MGIKGRTYTEIEMVRNNMGLSNFIVWHFVGKFAVCMRLLSLVGWFLVLIPVFPIDDSKL